MHNGGKMAQNRQPRPDDSVDSDETGVWLDSSKVFTDDSAES